jgi:hypothetical protein
MSQSAGAASPLDIELPSEWALPAPDGRTVGPSAPSARRNRRAEYRFEYGGPFSQIPVDRSGEMDDTAMETVSQASDHGQEVRNAPALPAAPKYSGATMQERREFMRQYETYCHALSAFETTGVRVFRVPVGVCIDERTRLIIANYEFGKPATRVTEAEWVSYFELQIMWIMKWSTRP